MTIPNVTHDSIHLPDFLNNLLKFRTRLQKGQCFSLFRLALRYSWPKWILHKYQEYYMILVKGEYWKEIGVSLPPWNLKNCSYTSCLFNVADMFYTFFRSEAPL